MPTGSYDVLIIGGGLGGIAAALRVLQEGYTVCLTEQTDWLGGQATSQGVSALDEPAVIERGGGTRLYYRFREGIREYYFERGLVKDGVAREHFNPGNAWVSKVCYEPKAALASIDQLLNPYTDTGQLHIMYGVRPQAVERAGNHIRSVTVAAATGQTTTLHGRFVIDATELGELFPLAHIPYMTGSEGFQETGEPHAIPGPTQPDWTQSFTFPFAVEYRPGENHTINKPAHYEYYRNLHPYSLTLWYGPKGCKRFNMFSQEPGEAAFWNYRRMIDANQFGEEYPNDIAQINWPGNDYHLRNIIDKSPAEERQILQEARMLSLGFLYWLQTEAPRDDGSGYGYPELKPRPDVMGTFDGLSKYPYIRESRRLRAKYIVKEQDISAEFNTGSRAKHFHDSVGIGHYGIDIHTCTGGQGHGIMLQSRAFQVPLGAMVAPGVSNLVPACKNIGVTHVVNGAYRLHPIEWAIGEGAGTVAAMSLQTQRSVDTIHDQPQLLMQLQKKLAMGGAPLAWYTDVWVDDPSFAAVQYLTGTGVIEPDANDLLFKGDQPLTAAEAAAWKERARALAGGAVSLPETTSRSEAARLLFEQV